MILLNPSKFLKKTVTCMFLREGRKDSEKLIIFFKIFIFFPLRRKKKKKISKME